jgi:hypothetical protein
MILRRKEAKNLGLAPHASDWTILRTPCPFADAEHADCSLVPARFPLVTKIRRAGFYRLVDCSPISLLSSPQRADMSQRLHLPTSSKILPTFLQTRRTAKKYGVTFSLRPILTAS